MAPEDVLDLGKRTFASMPTELLVAELSRRHGAKNALQTTSKPECGSRTSGSYDTPLHVGALFIILALSTLACAFPLLSRKSASRAKKPNAVIFYSQHFGTGVLMATAFVHLLPTAFMSLTDPCLPDAFNVGYPPMAGLVAMISALVVVGLESYLTSRGAGHSHNHHELLHTDDHDEDAVELDSARAREIRPQQPGLAARRGGRNNRPNNLAIGSQEEEGLMASISPLPGLTPPSSTNGHLNGQANGKPHKAAFDDDDDDGVDDSDEDGDLTLSPDELGPAPRPTAGRKRTASEATLPSSPDEAQRQIRQCTLLEAGILFHSVFIGMALSVATGPTFVIFLLAICFHQTFEGLALGSRIAALPFNKWSVRPWLMVLAFGATTPAGQAIGLVVHKMYDPLSQTGLLMVGFMNAISSGLLLFAGLVQLLAEDFLTEKSYKVLRGRRRRNAFVAVVAGSLLMAVVGAFA